MAKKTIHHYCNCCNRLIRFFSVSGARIPTETQLTYFIPNENSKTQFVTLAGRLLNGSSAADGRQGFKVHQCIDKK